MYFFDSQIPEKSSISYGIKKVYGLGVKKSYSICKSLGFGLNLKVKDLSDEQLIKLAKKIEEQKDFITSELKKKINLSNKKLFSINSYRGIRKKKGLPVRGQRTHTNAKTARKKKKKNVFIKNKIKKGNI
jgi:small subunit ribosomal protein S13